MSDCDKVEVTTDLIFAFLPTTALPLGQRNTDIKYSLLCVLFRNLNKYSLILCPRCESAFLI